MEIQLQRPKIEKNLRYLLLSANEDRTESDILSKIIVYLCHKSDKHIKMSNFGPCKYKLFSSCTLQLNKIFSV